MEDFIFGTTSLTDQIVKEHQTSLRGLWHGHRIEPLDPLPGQPVRLRLRVGPQITAQGVWCYYTIDGREPKGQNGIATVGTAIPLHRVNIHWEDLVWNYVEEWEGEIPGQPEGTLVRYNLEANGQYASGGEGSTTETPIFAYAVDRWTAPDWAWDAIIYHIFLDRFYPGDGQTYIQTDDLEEIMGGTLVGVRQKLPYVRDLGFNCIWLSPIYASPSYHRYDATDYYRVAEALGTNEDLHELVAEAHSYGMRVILDFVANHASNQHPFFHAAQADRQSPYCSWYTFERWPDKYKAFFGIKQVPQFNLEYAPARQYMLEVARYWMREHGVDGYRLDYALGPSRNFWTDFRRAVRSVRADGLTFAEAVTPPEMLRTFAGRVDGCLDFTWCEEARRTFATGKQTVADFERFLERHESYFGRGLILLTFLDNHDMNRFLWMAGGDKRRLRVAAACQFTLSQPPIVYYGTEVGLSQPADSRNHLQYVRLPMIWDEEQDHELMEGYRRLCAARHAHPALRRGDRIPTLSDGANGLLVYRKVKDEDSCCIILHAAEGKAQVDLHLAPGLYRDLLTDREYRAKGGSLRVKLEPWAAAILVPTH
nr:DUF3459 domain-containing protein [Chloroflexota bacterium]